MKSGPSGAQMGDRQGKSNAGQMQVWQARRKWGLAGKWQESASQPSTRVCKLPENMVSVVHGPKYQMESQFLPGIQGT